MEEKEILLIGAMKEYLFLSLADKLADASYNIIKSNPEIAQINTSIEQCLAIVLYVSDESMGNVKVLSYIRDKVLERNIPLFMVGEENQIQCVKKTVSDLLIEKEFYRPLNLIDMVEVLDDFFQHYDENEKKKILVVDDSGTVLRNVRGWLGEKYSVEVASSGIMAIRNMTLRVPDLVLLDYVMPVCDGPQVLQMIKAEPEFRNVPVMFLTGRSDKASVMKGLALKPDGYLLKSMSAKEIVAAIDEFFADQKSRCTN